MKYFKKILGERVYLSPMNVEDAETYVKWLNNQETTDKLGNSAVMISLESEAKWVAESSSKHQFAIVTVEGDRLLGNCGVNEIDHIRQTATIGLFIGDEENRDKGYGSDALRLLLKYCFYTLNVNNVMLCVFSFNERALKCYKKVGFKEFGRRRQAYYVNGERCDDIYMDILKEEFKY